MVEPITARFASWRLFFATIVTVTLALPASWAAPPTGVALLTKSRQEAAVVPYQSLDWVVPTAHPDEVGHGVPVPHLAEHSNQQAAQNWPTSELPSHGARHMGLGQPLEGTSWLNRPCYTGVFLGSWSGDTLLPAEARQKTGWLSGVWLGSDLGHYWGSEVRLSLAYIGLEYLPEKIQGDDSRLLLCDAHVMYYPWGDSKWRPFASLGMGLAGFHFVDRSGQSVNQSTFHLPWGFGLKYPWRRSVVFRVDLKDNMAFGSGRLNTTHNWSVTGGLELRWGDGSAARYYPW